MINTNEFLYELAKKIYTPMFKCNIELDTTYNPEEESHYPTKIIQLELDSSKDKKFYAKSPDYNCNTGSGCSVQMGKVFKYDELIVFSNRAMARIVLDVKGNLVECDARGNEGFDLLANMMNRLKKKQSQLFLKEMENKLKSGTFDCRKD